MINDMSGFNDLIKAQSSSLIEERLLLRAGKTWNIEWHFLDSERNFVDFQNATARCDFKDAGTGQTLLTFVSGLNPSVILGNGNIALVADADVTVNFATDADVEFVYEVEVVYEGKVLSAVAGTGLIKQEITTSG